MFCVKVVVTATYTVTVACIGLIFPPLWTRLKRNYSLISPLNWENIKGQPLLSWDQCKSNVKSESETYIFITYYTFD
uniref:Uncharacterized protein n=1 Tax=Anguilla anguilla TaxID=7936 RepID=A0A0E9SZU0_ANGAN